MEIRETLEALEEKNLHPKAFKSKNAKRPKEEK